MPPDYEYHGLMATTRVLFRGDTSRWADRSFNLDLRRRYRIILVPSSSFQLLVDPDDARAALGRFHHHLEPGGVLANGGFVDVQLFKGFTKEPASHDDWLFVVVARRASSPPGE